MRTIEIDDDIYGYLLQNTTQIGESASEILRRLLRLPGYQIKEGEQAAIPITKLTECLDDPAFRAQPNVIGKFLYILSYVHNRDPEQFKKVLELRGWQRKYFALSSEELEESGSSIYPKQIPNTQFWVTTNNDTAKKRRMIQQVLKLLGYSDVDVKQALQALT